MTPGGQDIPGTPEAVITNKPASVEKQMPGEVFCELLADFFKVLGDKTRVRILLALSFSEMRVVDIAVLLEMTQSSISHQLRILRQARLVRARKAGKSSFYSLDDEHVEHIVAEGFEHLRHGKASEAAL